MKCLIRPDPVGICQSSVGRDTLFKILSMITPRLFVVEKILKGCVSKSIGIGVSDIQHIWCYAGELCYSLFITHC